MNKNTIIIILVVLILGLSSYILSAKKQIVQTVSKDTAVQENVDIKTISEDQAIKPTDEVTIIGVIRDLYQKEGKYFVVVDYLSKVENPEYYMQLENKSKKLRTFEISKNTKIQLLKGVGGSEKEVVNPEKFYTVLKINNGEGYYGLGFSTGYPEDSVSNNSYGYPFYIKTKGDTLLELNQIYTS